MAGLQNMQNILQQRMAAMQLAKNPGQAPNQAQPRNNFPVLNQLHNQNNLNAAGGDPGAGAGPAPNLPGFPGGFPPPLGGGMPNMPGGGGAGAGQLPQMPGMANAAGGGMPQMPQIPQLPGMANMVGGGGIPGSGAQLPILPGGMPNMGGGFGGVFGGGMGAGMAGGMAGGMGGDMGGFGAQRLMRPQIPWLSPGYGGGMRRRGYDPST